MAVPKTKGLVLLRMHQRSSLELRALYLLRKGSPYFTEARPPLRLVGADRIGEDAVRLRYVVA